MKFVLMSVSLLLLSACNLNQNVAIRGMDLHTQTNDGDTYVNFESIVSLGNLKLPNSNIEIKNSDQHTIGEVAIQHLEDGTSRVAFSINYDEARKDETSKLDTAIGKNLPNEREIPSILNHDSHLISIPILSNSRIYIGGSIKDNFFAGIAINIPAFDHILTKIPSALNLFMTFPFSEEVLGTAGIYTGLKKTQNGLAIFAKKSQPLTANPTSTGPTATRNLASIKPDELSKVDHLTLFRLNYLFSKHAILRIQ